MLQTDIYINGHKLELFKDETIELNSSVQNINDISKVFTDFSQSFTVPASDSNNAIFQHYYNTDVDGTFNANTRQLGYIELGSLPFKFGTIQLENVKMNNLQPYSYTIRFFGAIVNLSDLFKEDELSVLDLSAYDHDFNEDIFDATYDETIADGDIYYPLISSVRNMEAGTGGITDILDNDGRLFYYQLKPALRLTRIIEAIEQHYGFTFDRQFLNRAVFDNLFMWLHREAGEIESFNDETLININSAGTLGDIYVTVDTTDETISYTNYDYRKYKVLFKVTPEAGYEDITYKIRIYNDDVEKVVDTGKGVKTFIYDPVNNGSYENKFTIQSVGNFEFTTRILVRKKSTSADPDFPFGGSLDKATTTPVQTLDGFLTVTDVIPKIKVADFIKSIIKMFNLVMIPINSNTFQLLPLNDWYDQGKLIDISDYVDTSSVVVNRPKLFKQIDFKYEKTGQILGERFRENNGDVGYGDLQSKYNVDGTELKVEVQFDNLVFERLQNQDTEDITNIQVGKSIDKTLEPYIGKPYIFYRNGYVFYEDAIKCDNHDDLTYTWLTSTENDLLVNQVTNSVNFSADISTYLYSEITSNLFSNYWQDYISDLYSLKRRITNYTGYFNIGTLIKLKLNDRLKIGDKAYIVNTLKQNLVTGKVDLELLNYIGPAYTSTNETIFLTADTIEYSADTEYLTADMISLYIPQYSAIDNGVEYTSLLVTPAAQNYDCKITANQFYSVIKVDTGDDTDWIELENSNGQRTGYLKILIDKYVDALTDDETARSMDLEVTIGDETFTITIIQAQI